jgi:uncharacterized protein (DUF342 family)
MTEVNDMNQNKDRNGYCKVNVAPNALEAFLVIEPPAGQGTWPAKSEAFEALQAENIIYGIDSNAIDIAINNHKTTSTLVARGKAPVTGKDSELNYLFDSKTIHKLGDEDEHGRVDYHETQTFQNVTVGQVIAVKIPAAPGEPGVDVLGRAIPAAPGKDKPIRFGKNVAWADDNLKIIATSGGEPSLVNNLLSVLPVHEVKGDVSLHTGNIRFSGNVVIHGNVESGFKVEADGDITVDGLVDTADIKAGGKLIIHGGVSGMDKSKISSGADFFAKYIEHATINSGGNITVKESIMHCHVNAGKKITVTGGKGLIVGGIISAGEEINANTIGSRLGTDTELVIGDSLKIQLEAHWETSHANPELEKKQAGAPEEAQAKLKEKWRIKVRDTIYPGVKVTIGAATLFIQDEIKYSILVNQEGEIHINPYR